MFPVSISKTLSESCLRLSGSVGILASADIRPAYHLSHFEAIIKYNLLHYDGPHGGLSN